MGGNIFDNAKAIKKENIEPTLNELFNELKRLFPAMPDVFFNQIFFLGSTGKKDISGDIDLGVDKRWLNPQHLLDLIRISNYGNSVKLDDVVIAYNTKLDKLLKRSRTSTPEQLSLKSILLLIGEYIANNSNIIEIELKKINLNSINVCFPQYNEMHHKLTASVQIDLNVGAEDWLKFAYYSDDTEIKGLYRTQLLVATCELANLLFSHANGIKDKKTNKILEGVNSPQRLVELLNLRLDISLTETDVFSFRVLFKKLVQTLDVKLFDKLINIYLKILDSTRCDIPEILHTEWMSRKQDLNLTGKFLPETSLLKRI